MSNEPQGKPQKNRKSAETTATTQRGIRRERRGTGVEVADWEACDADLLRHCIAAVSARGCAIQFGYTRDGGAYAIRFVGDGEPYMEYVRPTEDVDVWLASVVEDFAK